MAFDFDAFAAECPTAILVIAGDGRIVFANRALASLVGFGLQELERESISAILPTSLTPPEATTWMGYIVDRTGPTRRAKWPLCHRSKTEIETEWTVLPGHDPTGRSHLQITVSAPTGIPEARRSEPQGPASAQAHSIIFENAPIGIFHFDARATITECNERFVRLIGSSRRHLIGLRMPTLPNAAMANVANRAIAGELATYEGPYTSATGGKTSWVRVMMAPVKDERGTVTGGVGIVEDASEQRRASELVAATERLASLGTLAAGVVHEVQNPLAYVIASLDLGLRQLEAGGDREELRASLASAREGATRVASIARDLKTFAKSDEALRGPVDVAAVLDTAIKLTDAAIRMRATLVRRIENVGTVWASEPRLVQLFVNLLMNAAEAIPAGDVASNTITISARALDDQRVRVDVEDTGPGISDEDAARIFEPFWTGKDTGMGLGLAICLGIVSSTGGEIFVDRDRPLGARRGARFAVILPPSSGRTSNPSPTRTPVSPTPVEPPLRGRVLIVDDEQRLAETLRLSLSAAHDVTIATRGKQALELLLREPAFDVVLCDILMPDLSGVDLFAEIGRRRPELVERFVFLTGGAFSEGIREFLQQIPNPRIEKPFDLETLEALIDERVRFAREPK